MKFLSQERDHKSLCILNRWLAESGGREVTFGFDDYVKVYVVTTRKPHEVGMRHQSSESLGDALAQAATVRAIEMTGC